jgi:phosphatidylserine synthase
MVDGILFVWGVLLINNDLLLSLASILYVICAIPQLVRNLRFKDTITQSIFSNLIILVATMLSLVAYMSLGLYSASIFMFLEIAITIILIAQIIVWRNNRRNKKIKEMVEKTEGARSILRSVRGVK